MSRAARGISAELLGTRFRFEAPSGLFSTERVDDGTRLLLDHLPERPPSRVLDLGCGYGALGLPVAARYPKADCLLVDRLVPAVEVSQRNARAHGLSRVQAQPSLGLRELSQGLRFDWILCNVPARIGADALAAFVEEGARRLSAHGELRIVVINDLAPIVERLTAERGWPMHAVAEGLRHRVFASSPISGAPPSSSEEIYLRDAVIFGTHAFDRPHDISEDPAHQREGLPLLLELLPRRAMGSALVWRGGYGVAAVTLAARGTKVVAADVDLLATSFTRRNAMRHRVAVETRDTSTLQGALVPGDTLGCVAAELAPHLDDEGMKAEVGESLIALAPGGEALWLGLSTRGRTMEARGGLAVARRGPFTVWRFTPSPPGRAGQRRDRH